MAQIPGLTNVTQVSVGARHTVALRSDGTVWSWGSNGDGQLGHGSTTTRVTPTQVPGLTTMVSVSAASYHTVALKSDGTVWAWGYNFSGQLGDGTTASRFTPVQVLGLSGVTSVATSDFHTVALKSDGTVWAWGNGTSGQLGRGNTTSYLTPVQVANLTAVISVSAGYSHTVALKSDGTVWTWGYNGSGQLGDGTTTNRTTPTQVPGFVGVASVSAGWDHTAVVKLDGTVWTWGSSAFSQLGDGTSTDRPTPAQVPGLTNIVSVSAFARHSVAVRADGTVWTWGYNSYGQLGDGTATNRPTPGQVSGLNGMIGASARGDTTVAVRSDGTVWGWGNNIDGQLGVTPAPTVQVVGEGGVGFLNLRTAAPPPPASRVLFLHGLMGSRLYACEFDAADSTWKDTEVWPTGKSWEFARLALPDPATRRVHVGPLLDEVFGSNVYLRFETSMLSDFPGWTALSYDWRLSLDDILDSGSLQWDPGTRCANTASDRPRGMLQRVKELLDGMGPGGKLIVVTHSNGGLLAKRLINRLQQDSNSIYRDRIDKLVFVAVPHYGAPKAITQMMHGLEFPIPTLTIDPAQVESVSQAMPGVYNLLPSAKYFQGGLLPPLPAVAKYLGSLAQDMFGGISGEADPLAIVNQRIEFENFAIATAPYVCAPPAGTPPNLNYCLGAPRGVKATHLAQAIATHSSSSDPSAPALDDFVIPPGTRVYQFVGTGLDTISGMNYWKEVSPGVGTFVIAGQAMTSFGDGTVPARSALAIPGAETFWIRLNNCNARLNNREHSNILELDPLQAALRRIIRDEPTDWASLGENAAAADRCIDPIGIVSAPPPPVHGVDTLRATLASPADIHVYDGSGAHTGRIASPVAGADFQFAEQQIPGSSFRFPHAVSLPTRGGPYRFELRGNASGVASLTIERFVDDQPVSKVVYPNFQVTPSTVARVSLTTPDERPSLSVDSDGDGHVDRMVPPAVTRPPVALVSGPTVVRMGSLVSADGRDSYDPDREPAALSYAWTMTGSPSAPVSGADTSRATFRPATPGTYMLSLVVHDGALASEPAILQVVVPLLGDINRDGVVDSRDLNLLLAALNQPANGPHDLRDLNGDGKIDALDSRVLTTRCTKPRCAI